MKYCVLLIIILIVFVLWRKMSNSKKKQDISVSDDVEEPKVSFLPIILDNEIEINAIENNSPFDFEISSITKKQDTLELLITIFNHSDKTVRIDLKEAIYSSFTTKSEFKADVTFYGELNMGTNDILLKNTILPDLQVIRNIYFFHLNLTDFHQNDALAINVLINNEPYQFKKYLHQSSLQSIKVIE